MVVDMNTQMYLVNVLLPRLLKRQIDIDEKQSRFVHYTSASVGMSIIKEQKVWMRNASCMNDFSEMTFGIENVVKFFNSDNAKPMWSVLNRIQKGLGETIHMVFNSWVPDLQTNTWLTCISEHDDREDTKGRLSMWRAYGQPTGVALVFNSKVFTSPTDALKAYSYPVLYHTEEELKSLFGEIVGNVVANEEGLKALDAELVKEYILHMLQSHCICLKHPGFEEEREWRVVYRPNQEKSNRLEKSIEIINGVPQKIYQIPLQDVPEENLVGLELDQFLDRIIIGPNEHPYVAWEAFVEVLRDAGVSNPEQRVIVSDIPLRT
ncbi:DUF2971 domain-containing protein [Emcibacter nanhaiensis]|uniref:DUF2971 domain-containing protein n=1 Tax=Emcibacter nanhaiensis TaxID=1505037 RepID=A0A501PC93_9PROT|nr:DUF2971 domain-containing protein [Emcibacter nanhaiensis]TPD57642.1 DUF2971 domain-containing protein [Emcibacter nanhaiensis]